MVYVVIFSLSVAIFSSTHQIGWVILGMVVIWGVLQKIQKDQNVQRIQSFALCCVMVIVGVLAVVIYDRRMMGSWERLVDFYQGFEHIRYLSDDAQLLVTERDKMGRYIVENSEGSEGSEVTEYKKSVSLLLYSEQELNPGDIVMTTRKPIWRIDQSNKGKEEKQNDGSLRSSVANEAIHFLYCRLLRRESCYSIDRSSQGQQDDIGLSSLQGQKKEGRFDYNKWLYMQGIDGSLYDNHVAVVDQQSLGWIENMREGFYQRVKEKYANPPDPLAFTAGDLAQGGESSISTNNPPQPLPQREGQIVAGLVAGMTIGDRSMIDKDRYQQFIDSGLVHLVAVSGGNIAIIVMFVGLLLFWLPFYVRQFVLLVSIVFYAMLVGNDSSIIRAAVMGALTILALFPGRQISIRRSMGYTWVGMLLRNPYYLLYDLGFSLSFAAIVGIVEMEEWMQRTQRETEGSEREHKVTERNKREQKIQKWIVMMKEYVLKNYIMPTLGAMAGVTPLLLWSMEQTNIASPLFNFLVVPLVPIVTIGGFISPFLPDAMSRCLVTFVHLVEWIVQVSAWGREYGVYMSMTDEIKDIFLIIVVGVWIYKKVKVEK